MQSVAATYGVLIPVRRHQLADHVRCTKTWAACRWPVLFAPRSAAERSMCAICGSTPDALGEKDFCVQSCCALDCRSTFLRRSMLWSKSMNRRGLASRDLSRVVETKVLGRLMIGALRQPPALPHYQLFIPPRRTQPLHGQLDPSTQVRCTDFLQDRVPQDTIKHHSLAPGNHHCKRAAHGTKLMLAFTTSGTETIGCRPVTRRVVSSNLAF
ncbi:hypothetical protein BU25DRAFT_235384 [Macroventuria anomochaeta]|uniref:Uncharacterized protein n=1 Tax=Macroventuria anomochaeta TaxID=301207 RepID=A0ACB6RI35_9PLEO|nr:uncharacterized protein BU25DRAFT_235384 [Macroventuria anomochaeta]KAF2621605.1 hypothetical protein BU25DRAFT_235384 [Macroventuria anomochaeta]